MFALQALLARHEAYMIEAEEERRKMGSAVDKLEGEKKELEASNARTIEENRYLLDQLEALNNTVLDADSQITSLNATLQSTVKELDRLTVLAAQTGQLEKQLASLEAEQYAMQQEVSSREDGEKSAIQRWKNAERTVNALQEQLERIEKEAREEQARHAEVVSRLERRRLVERELESAAGRLKGAAAAKGMGREDGNQSVVSSFVKDILQDNANLQFGIVELRDMLMGSNQEVENLREQMVLHQPLLPNIDEDGHAGPSKTSFLDNELARTPTADIMSDFHVHHHYHTLTKDESKKTPTLRRPKKRRNITSPGLRTPNSGSQTPRTQTSSPMHLTTPSSAAAILAQTSVTIPPASHMSHAHNWSMSQAPSSAALSSMPSSPIFDVMSDMPDSSRPTTPGSTHFGSPQFPSRHINRGSEVSDYNLPVGQNAPQSISGILHGEPNDDFDEAHFPMLDHNMIPEEPEDDPTTSRSTTQNTTEDYDPTQVMRPSLHRASSHESLLSVRGLDIPKLRSKPSTRFLSGRQTSIRTSVSSGIAITSATAATAHRSKAPRGFDSKTSYSNLLSASGGASSTSPPSTTNKSSLGNRVGSLGGWITGRWGVAPTSAIAATTTVEGLTSPTGSTFSRTSVESKEKAKAARSSPSTTTHDAKVTARQSDQSSSKKSNGPSAPTTVTGRRAAADDRSPTHMMVEPAYQNDTQPPTKGSVSIPTAKTVSVIAAVASAAAAAADHGKATPIDTKAQSSLSSSSKKLAVRSSMGRSDKRLSTHVEAVNVDDDGLADALGDL